MSKVGGVAGMGPRLHTDHLFDDQSQTHAAGGGRWHDGKLQPAIGEQGRIANHCAIGGQIRLGERTLGSAAQSACDGAFPGYTLSETERETDPLTLLAAHPALMKRPLIVAGDKMHLGWSAATRTASDASLGKSWLFEISWEVCNKVGGIHTVLSSKENTALEQFGDRYFTVGPLLLSDTDRDVPFDDEPEHDDFVAACRALGYEVRVGR